MSTRKRKLYHYRITEMLKMIFISCLLFISFLYIFVFYQEIFDYFELDISIFSAEDLANQSENYNHVFNLLEADIRVSEEVIETTEESYSDEYHQELQKPNSDEIILNDTAVELQDLKAQQHFLDKNKKSFILADPPPTIQNNTLYNQTTQNDNVYILPLADAFEKHTTDTKRNILKQKIIQEYDQRKELSTKIKNFEYTLNKDINHLRAVFMSMRTPIPAKFTNLKADIRNLKMLDKFQLSQNELVRYYPNLIQKIHELYRLKVFASFLPINNPVLNARRSSRFGYRSDPFTHKAKMHAGLDFAAPTGVAVFATGVGIIKFAGVKSGYGNAIDIYHGNGIITRYAHLSRIFIKQGQRVSIGQKIGAVGSTGRSTGPHLHYEVRIHNNPTNPEVFLNSKLNILNILIKYK